MYVISYVRRWLRLWHGLWITWPVSSDYRLLVPTETVLLSTWLVRRTLWERWVKRACFCRDLFPITIWKKYHSEVSLRAMANQRSAECRGRNWDNICNKMGMKIKTRQRTKMNIHLTLNVWIIIILNIQITRNSLTDEKQEWKNKFNL